MTDASEPIASCPLPIHDYPIVTMAHGGGGRMTRRLIESVFVPAFDNDMLGARHDGAVFAAEGRRVAFTTDSYVVHPLFFPGSDIGALAVNGTVNDLAMCGAAPAWLSAGFIIEEGLPMETLRRVVDSMRRAALGAGVRVVTGDTKVVDKGKADGLFINTAGVGWLRHERVISPAQVRPGDAILLSGDIARHGMAILAVREGLAFEGPIESDCAPLAAPVQELMDRGVEVHCLRDLTRGGLATALIEIADDAGCEIRIEESAIPVTEPVRGACELLGFDPLYVANEGRFVAFVPEADEDRALDALRRHDVSRQACRIGTVAESAEGRVILKSVIGSCRLLDLLSGDQLPRIC